MSGEVTPRGTEAPGVWHDDAAAVFVSVVSQTILEHAPDTWDGDESAAAITADFVKHAVSEVQRLGGCLHRWCAWNENEPCDHGYLPEKAPPAAAGVRQHSDTCAPTREEVAVVVAWFFAESDTPYDIVDEFVRRDWLAVSDGAQTACDEGAV